MTLNEFTELNIKFNNKLSLIFTIIYRLFFSVVPTVGVVLIFFDFWRGVALLGLFGLRELVLSVYRIGSRDDSQLIKHLKANAKLIRALAKTIDKSDD